jgi:hypothetical protein
VGEEGLHHARRDLEDVDGRRRFVCHGVVAIDPTAAVRPVGPGISLTPVKLEPEIPE